MFNSLYSTLKVLWYSPTATTWASFFSKTIYTIVLLPIAMTQLTVEEINIWLLLNIFVGLQMLGDLGFSATFTRAISHAYGGALEILIHKKISLENNVSTKPNWVLIQKIFTTTSFLYFLLSIILVISFSIIGYYSLNIPISRLEIHQDGWISFGIILIGIFIKFNGSKYQIYLQGINQVALLQRNIAIISSITIVAASIIVLQTKSLVLLILIQQLGQVAIVIVLRFIMKKYQKINKVLLNRANKIDFNIIKSIFPIAWRSWVGALMSYGLVQTSGIILAQFGSAAQTSSYLLSIKILDIIKNFANAPFYSKLPYFNQLFIKKEIKELLKLVFQRMNISLIILTFSMGIVGILGNDILELMGSKAMLVNSTVWIILMLAYYIERYGALHIQLYSLSNNIIWHIANTVTGILFISLSFLFIKSFDNPIFAFSVALLISYLSFYTWFSAYNSYRFFKINFLKTEYKTTLSSFIILIFMIILNILKILK